MSVNILNLSLSRNKWGEVSDEVEVLGVGGTNLFSQQNYSHHSNVGYNPSIITSAVVKIDPDTQYTVSFKSTESNRFGIWQGDLPSGMMSDLENRNMIINFYRINIGDVIQRTFTTHEDGEYIIIYLSNENPNAREPSLMVEKGDTASPYVPAPEDINASPISTPLSQISFLSGQNHDRVKDLTNAILSLGGSEV